MMGGPDQESGQPKRRGMSKATRNGYRVVRAARLGRWDYVLAALIAQPHTATRQTRSTSREGNDDPNRAADQEQSGAHDRGGRDKEDKEKTEGETKETKAEVEGDADAANEEAKAKDNEGTEAVGEDTKEQEEINDGKDVEGNNDGKDVEENNDGKDVEGNNDGKDVEENNDGKDVEENNNDEEKDDGGTVAVGDDTKEKDDEEEEEDDDEEKNDGKEVEEENINVEEKDGEEENDDDEENEDDGDDDNDDDDDDVEADQEVAAMTACKLRYQQQRAVLNTAVGQGRWEEILRLVSGGFRFDNSLLEGIVPSASANFHKPRFAAQLLLLCPDCRFSPSTFLTVLESLVEQPEHLDLVEKLAARLKSRTFHQARFVDVFKKLVRLPASPEKLAEKWRVVYGLAARFSQLFKDFLLSTALHSPALSSEEKKCLQDIIHAHEDPEGREEI